MHKVYIELTSKCGLSCDFCPSASRTLSTMDLELFTKINKEVKTFTNDIAYHVVGDPLQALNHPCIKQINFSLNSYRGNTLSQVSYNSYRLKF